MPWNAKYEWWRARVDQKARIDQEEQAAKESRAEVKEARFKEARFSCPSKVSHWLEKHRLAERREPVCAPVHSVEQRSARGPDSALAAPIRGWPGNHGGSRAVEEGMHRSRAQPPQRATHVHPR